MPRSARLDAPGVLHRIMMPGWTAERYSPSYLLSPAGKYVSSASVTTDHALLFQEFQQIIQYVHLDDMAGMRPVERNWRGRHVHKSASRTGCSTRLVLNVSQGLKFHQAPSGRIAGANHEGKSRHLQDVEMATLSLGVDISHINVWPVSIKMWGRARASPMVRLKPHLPPAASAFLHPLSRKGLSKGLLESAQIALRHGLPHDRYLRAVRRN